MNTEENNNIPQGNFSLPDGYFIRSASAIKNKLEWEEENKEYPCLYELRNKNVFAVPPAYFTSGQCRLELVEFTALTSIKKQQVFKTPDNYFEMAEEAELAKVLPDTGKELVAFEKLELLKKQNSFKVNEDYFAVNEVLLNTLLKPDHKPARIIDLFFSRSWYVAAALLVIGLGLWLYSVYVRPVQVEKDCGTMACIDKADLVRARNLEGLDDEELYELVKSGELEKNLQKDNVPIDKKDSGLKSIPLEEMLDEI